MSLLQDISTARFMFNMVRKNTILDNLRDAVVGDFKWSARNADFSGWLICDGRAVSRTAYADLFSIIGTSFGAGNGTTTFNLPDCRGRVAGGIGQGPGLINRALGGYTGTETHTLTEGEMPAHTHGVNDPGHSHYYEGVTGQGVNGISTTDAADDSNRPTETTSTSATGITINSAGGGLPHNNMQPTVFLGNVFIYTGVAEYVEPYVPVGEDVDVHEM